MPGWLRKKSATRYTTMQIILWLASAVFAIVADPAWAQNGVGADRSPKHAIPPAPYQACLAVKDGAVYGITLDPAPAAQCGAGDLALRLTNPGFKFDTKGLPIMTPPQLPPCVAEPNGCQPPSSSPMSNVWLTFPTHGLRSTFIDIAVLNPGDAGATYFCVYFDHGGRFLPEISVRRSVPSGGVGFCGAGVAWTLVVSDRPILVQTNAELVLPGHNASSLHTSLPVNCVDDTSVGFLCSAARVFVRALVTGPLATPAHRVYASPRYPGVDRRFLTLPRVLNPGLTPVRITCVYIEDSGRVPIDLIRTLTIEPGGLASCEAIADTGRASLLLFGDQPILVHSETRYSRILDREGLEGVPDIPVWTDSNAVYPLDCDRPLGAEFFCRLYEGFR